MLQRASHNIRGLGLALCCLLFSLASTAAQLSASSITTHTQDGVVYMDAQISYDFSASAAEALQSGVPLTIEIEVQLKKQRKWLWDPALVNIRLRYMLLYRSVASLYQVVNLDTGTSQNFVDFGAALIALGTVKDLPVIPQAELDKQAVYEGRIRASLDREALPTPLRPSAYLSKDWKHKTPWAAWSLPE